MSTSGSINSVVANSTRMRQPPLRKEVGRSCMVGVKPRPVRILRALPSAENALIEISSDSTSSRRADRRSHSSAWA